MFCADDGDVEGARRERDLLRLLPSLSRTGSPDDVNSLRGRPWLRLAHLVCHRRENEYKQVVPCVSERENLSVSAP